MKKLAIIMPVWNNWHYTKRAIEMLSSLPNDHLLIIVDNGSYDDTKNLVSTNNCHVIRLEKNFGFGKACNAGFSYAKKQGFEYAMFLNNDIKVQGEHNSWTLSLIEAASDGSIVGPTVGCLDINLNFVCESSKYPMNGYGYLSGWNITAQISTWDRLVLPEDEGPFSTEFFCYFEDTDLGFRAKELGIVSKVVHTPLKHFGKGTSKKIGTSLLYQEAKKIFINKWTSNNRINNIRGLIKNG